MSGLRRQLRAIWGFLPHGRTLPVASWEARNRAVVWLLAAHAVAFAVIVVVIQQPFVDAVTSVAVPGVGAWAASRTGVPRVLRSAMAAVSAMLTSAVVVHLMNGSIEAHFHFFAMIPVVALYEDWIPFGLAVGVVLVHHGLMGTLQPGAVYDHKDAWAHPWRFALIHAAFFGSACVGSIVNWRLHEKARDSERTLSRQMRHQARHDLLTGLPNRTRLLEHARNLLPGDQRSRQVAVLLIDLDRFKDINDVLGHSAGDQLLASLGPRLAAVVRENDLVARLGGDEFAAVLADADAEAAVSAAKRLLATMTEAVFVDGVALDVEASIGIAVAKVTGSHDIDRAMREADIAMYVAKRARCGYMVYEPGQDTATRERLTLLGDLRRALDAGEIVLHYQPKFGVESQDLVGVEALARWQHPTRGLVGPGDFIPAAESTGLIIPLTLYVLDRAIAQVRAWSDAGCVFPIAVNLSPRCLAEPELAARIFDLLGKHGVSPGLLELEITENTLAHDPDRALAALTALNAGGIRISIDDFGTGYSSMQYLKRLPVSELKIDRSFVMGMLDDNDDAVLVRSVVDLGHNLALTVVAEGVEDASTLQALREVGCDVAQGYHLGRPMSQDAFDSWLGSRVEPPQLPTQRTSVEGVVA